MPRLQNADPFDAALGRDPDGNRLDSENVAGASKSDGNRDTEKLVWYGGLGTSIWAPYQLGSNGSPSCDAWGVNHPGAIAQGYRHG